MKLTEMERKAVQEGFSFNYDNAEDNKTDNANYCDIEDVARALGITKQQASGVCVSLRNKDLIFEDRVNGMPIYMVTEKGIDEHFNHIK